jgi:hypothetical protein
MARGKLLEDIGEKWIFVNPAEAVQKCSSLLAEGREVDNEANTPQAGVLFEKGPEAPTSTVDVSNNPQTVTNPVFEGTEANAQNRNCKKE